MTGKSNPAAVLVVFLVCAATAYGRQWQITQLTNNDSDDLEPRVSDSRVVWYGTASPRTVFSYDGATTAPLAIGQYPEVGGTGTAWQDDGIWFYDGVSAKMLATEGVQPRVWNSRVAWRGHGFEIYYHDGTETRKLSEPFDPGIGYIHTNPYVSESYVIWQGRYEMGLLADLYVYDGEAAFKLASGINEYSIDTHGSTVVWSASDGNDSEIYSYDGSMITQVTDNDYDDTAPKVWGANIAWQGKVGNLDWEILLSDGESVTQITDNDYADDYLDIYGSTVVWEAKCGSNGTDEVFLYDAGVVTRLTDNAYSDIRPRIAGSRVVWMGSDGNDMEVFTAIPEPASLSLFALGALALRRRSWGYT